MHLAKCLLLLTLTLMTTQVPETSGCDEATPCRLSDGLTGMCHNDTCLAGVSVEPRTDLVFTISVRYPDKSMKRYGGQHMYIRGDGLGLEWTVGTRLTKVSPDTWQLYITYQSSLAGYACQNCRDRKVLHDNKLQYRVFMDNMNMLGANFVISFPMSQSSAYFTTKPEYVVHPWFHEKTGTIDSLNINSMYLGDDRNLSVYYPPSFYENTLKSYPVFVVFDLSVDFAYFFKRNLEEPIVPFGIADEYFLIGFGDYKNNGSERTEILTQTVGMMFECFNGTLGNGCDGCIPRNATTEETVQLLNGICAYKTTGGGRGDDTLDFLVNEAIPTVAEKAEGRIDMARVGAMGYSLGGLMSCYAAWTRPRSFSMAACQSPSFWWPYKNGSMNDADFDFVNKTMKNDSYAIDRPPQKIYIDAGGNEAMAPYNLTQSAVEVAQIMCKHGHYEMNSNVWVVVDPGREHSYIQWGKRMGLALSTLLAAPGDPGMPAESGVQLIG